MQNKYWEHFHHIADIGVRGVGKTPEEAFEQAALALTAVITDIESVLPETKLTVHCEADDQELLFADWLNAVLYEMDIRKMLFSRYQVLIHDNILEAEIFGEKTDPHKHAPAVEIKGATYTSLKVKKNKRGQWIAQCIVDV
ncbi:MAG: archease [Proteobacteria bacterium]|nr:archease [Pseudomonadota bacterium]